jgi:hypothetical protein
LSRIRVLVATTDDEIWCFLVDACKNRTTFAPSNDKTPNDINRKEQENNNNLKRKENEKDYDNGCSRHAGYGKC